MSTGRFAPSPTGPLHLGNLRTALAAWWFARSGGGRFVLRMEDLDRVTSHPHHEASQLRNLAAIGIDWDGEITRQSERFDLHRFAIADLVDRGLTYPCYCTRREIRMAAAAPHRTPPRYPGTCRELDAADRRRFDADGRPSALRLRRQIDQVDFDDAIAGAQRHAVDDIVLQRNDGVPAYNLAVVVDDDEQGIDQVVRGDDLLEVTASQLHLIDLLGRPRPQHGHVPLVLNANGERIAKRDGPVGLDDLVEFGHAPSDVVSFLAGSLGQLEVGERVERASDLLARFAPVRIPREPVRLPEDPRSWLGEAQN